ncbi:MAG TPA: DUF934 domain-containing protein [Steroidobacteraceae bacterium]|jgi:uncharacterized protein (DUF934 family)
MRQIIFRREPVEDTARYPGEQADPGTRAVLTAAQFLAAASAAELPGGGAAVLIGPTDELGPLLPYLSLLSLIVVDFPKLGDGRGFSQARMLRQRYRYTGELRARGVLKRDQMFFLARCGFDSFDLDPNEDLTAAIAALDSFSVAYQEGSETVIQVQRRAPAA